MSNILNIPPVGTVLAGRYRLVVSDIEMHHEYDARWHLEVEMLRGIISNYAMIIPLDRKVLTQDGMNSYIQAAISHFDNAYMKAIMEMGTSQTPAMPDWKTLKSTTVGETMCSDFYQDYLSSASKSISGKSAGVMWYDEYTKIPDWGSEYQSVNFIKSHSVFPEWGDEFIIPRRKPQEVDDLIDNVIADTSEFIDAIF